MASLVVAAIWAVRVKGGSEGWPSNLLGGFRRDASDGRAVVLFGCPARPVSVSHSSQLVAYAEFHQDAGDLRTHGADRNVLGVRDLLGGEAVHQVGKDDTFSVGEPVQSSDGMIPAAAHRLDSSRARR